MDSKFNIDGKISADAMSRETNNLNSNVTNSSSVFKDQKRVIKKMIVMDTSKLKALGIEATIKNAMSKLEKGKRKTEEHPTFKHPHVRPMYASSKLLDTVVKSEFEPKIESDTVMKHQIEPVVTPKLPVQSNNMSARSSTPHNVHHIRSPAPSTATLNNSAFQSVKSPTPSVPVMRKVAPVTAVPTNSTNRVHQLIVPSMPTKPIKVEQTSGSIPNNLENSKRCKSEVVQPATTKCTTDNPIIKTESTVASDGKKIKILSDVSLNDTKAKLLEIDKLSSKNLKFTNVIKGTDKSSSKPTVHVADNPVIPPHSRPAHFKPEIDKVSHSKYTNVIKGTDQGQSRSTVSTSNFTNQPQTTTAKPLKIEIKNLNLRNAADAMHKSTAKVTFHIANTVKRPARSLSTSSISAKSEDNGPATSKNLKYANVIEGMDQSKYKTQPLSFTTSVRTDNKTFSSKTFNSYNVTEGISSKSTVHTSNSTNQHASPSYSSSKNIRPGTNTISSKNANFTNANTSKPPINFSNSATKPVPMYLPTEPPKSGREEIRPNDLNLPNVKSTKEPPMAVKTPTFKVKPIASMCSTSAEGSAKQLAATDENIEIIMPSKQKYLRKERICIDEPTPIIDATKSLQDVLWDTNNLRTYRRHNIKRLLSDKIIKKSRLQEDRVQNVLCTVENEQTIETVNVEANDIPTATTPGECDSISEQIMSVQSKPICNQPTVSTPSLRPAEVESKVVQIQSETVSKNNFYGFTIEEVNESASVLNRIKDLLSRRPPSKAREREEIIGTVDCENDQWVLNYETGVLEKQIDKDVTTAVTQQDVGLSTTDNDGNLSSQLRPVNELNPTKEIPPAAQILEDTSKDLPETQINSPVFDISPTPTKIPVIEDADDEISDIDLVHRSKAKCTGNTITPAVKNRRAILKSIELHRKAFMPATTDDESELSLCVRPPRPKLRKSRQKQTVEQLKIQQNAHVSLLRRFTQTDLDCDNLNDEDLVYFLDGMMDRVEVLENQVKCCFNPENPNELNVENSSLSEQSASTVIDTVIEKNESVKSSEKVTENHELVTPSESSSTVNTSMNCVAASEDHSNLPNNAETAGDDEGQSMIQEVTIQKDTFLVIEYDNQCDKINHLPLTVKLEKETSPKPSCSINRNRVKKTIRKKRKRKSLVEMLAQHVDQDTLKSVIIAHAKQKCDFSSSSDSENEDDSDERGDEMGDVISKIFRTVCTIDLCDDDDETLHEDVLQYMNEENEHESVPNPASGGPVKADQLHSNIDASIPVQHPKLLDEQSKPVKTTSESLEQLIEIRDKISAADETTISEDSIQNPKVCEDSEPSKEVDISSLVHTVSTSEKLDDIAKKLPGSAEIPSEAARTETQNEITSPSSLGISKVLVMETESNNVTTSGDVKTLDESISSAHQTINISKSDSSAEIDFSNIVQSPRISREPDEIATTSQVSVENVSEVATPDLHNEITISSPLVISNVAKKSQTSAEIIAETRKTSPRKEISSASSLVAPNVVETETINVTFDDAKILNAVVVVEKCEAPQISNRSKSAPNVVKTESNNVTSFDDAKILNAVVVVEKCEASQTSNRSKSAPNVVKTESNNVTTLDVTKMLNAVVVVEKYEAPQTINRSKSENAISTPKDFKKTVLKLRPFEEISSHANPKNAENETLVNSKIRKKLSFEETLTKTDSITSEAKHKVSTKGKHKVQKKECVDVIENAITENPIDANQNNSRLHAKSLKSETANKVMEKPLSDKIKLSEVSTADPIKSGKNLQEPKLDCNSPIPLPQTEIMNESKPNRSRKRKSQVSEIPATPATATPIQSETTRKRPIFEYFDSPEILTTKRARKSKSYVDDEIRSEEVPTTTRPPSQRTSKRKSNVSKSYVENDEPKSESKVRKFVEKPANDHKDIPSTEPLEDVPSTEPLQEVAEPKVEDNIKLPSSTVPKTGRGIKQPKPTLAPLKIADKYDCGNCKEEVLAKNWTKHIRVHYGLAWRVGVDEAIDLEMDIHKLAAKVLNYTKKANIRNLKCPKCNDEKKSALGYISHLELCGLTAEEKNSKKLKCEYCPSIVRSCSMSSHLKYCSGLKRLMQKEKETNQGDDGSPEECFNDTGRAVRRSAQKAMSSFKDLNKPPEAKIEDYVERVQKISYKQHRKWRQQLKENCRIECVRNGCQFTSDEIGPMLDHFNTCVLIDGETFYCNRCEFGPDTRAVIEEHIKANHSLGVIEAIDAKDFSDSDDEAEVGEESSESDAESGDDESLGKGDEEHDDEFDDDDEDDDGWNTKGYKKKRQREWPHNEVMINSCLDRKVLSDHATMLKTYSGGSYFQPTMEWTQDFRDKHFSNENLLPFATPNSFSVLNSTLADLYIPKVSISNKFFVKEVRKYKRHHGSTKVHKSDVWKSLKRFEATKENNTIVIFTGGPILSMAWLPVPDDNLSQILAVCCRSDPTEDISLNNTKPTKCLIQIWNFNKLKNGQLRHAQSPHLLYSIAYDHGPVIQMEFCPSGGFTEDRLGLLAVSSYDGHVDILSLPKNFTCDNSKIENSFFIIPPSLTLCCELEKPLNVLLTKLVWSQSKGHTKLAGGYSNGLVAIWNLKNFQSSHNCSKINGVFTILPTDLFFAGNTTIKLLEFHHDEKNEARWLITGTHDRKVKFFDTHNVSIEISSTTAHSRIVAGCWPIHWSAFLVGIDNAYSLKVSGIVVRQPLDIGSRTSTFYSCIGSTCDISFNNWLNSYVFVTSYGDIHVGYVRQMISGYTETRRQRSILGFTDSVNIDQSNSMESDVTGEERLSALDEPSTSSACTLTQASDNLYPSTDGIIFCDFDNPLPAVTSPSYETIRGPPMDVYNMVKVNRILFNPNVSAYKLYAIGYECGFVRINQLLPR